MKFPLQIALRGRMAVLATICLSILATPAAAQLLWSDEFDEGVAPDPQYWSYDLGATGWGNQELQEYTDNQGNPIFLVGTGTPEGDPVTITFESPVGMIFGEFDPASVTREPGGEAEIVFTDRGNAAFGYTPSEFSVNTWGHSAVADLAIVQLFGIGAEKSFAQPNQ